MGRYRNAMWGDAQVAAITSNLAKAFIDPDPAGTEYKMAGARVNRIKADAAQRAFDATARRAQLAGAGRVFSPGEAGEYVKYSILDGSDPNNAYGHVRGMYSLTGAGEDDVARSAVAAGAKLQPYDAFTPAGQAAKTTRKEGAEMARTATSASIAAGASRANNADRLKFEEGKWKEELGFKERTRWDKPDHVPQGAAAFFNPDDPRYAGRKPGEIPAPRPMTTDEVKAGALQGVPGAALGAALPPVNVPQGAAAQFAPGDPRFPGTQPGTVIAPKPPEDFTLAPDATRYRNDGTVVATAPSRPSVIGTSELVKLQEAAKKAQANGDMREYGQIQKRIDQLTRDMTKAAPRGETQDVVIARLSEAIASGEATQAQIRQYEMLTGLKAPRPPQLSTDQLRAQLFQKRQTVGLTEQEQATFDALQADKEKREPRDIRATTDDVFKAERILLQRMGLADGDFNPVANIDEIVSPADRAKAQAAWADAYRKTDGDSTAADRAYYAAIGKAPGAKWDPGNSIPIFGREPGWKGGGAASVFEPPPAPQRGQRRPAPQASPPTAGPRTQAAPPAPPNAAERKPGQVYQTARGPMKWMVTPEGSGWAPAQ